jgi:hypothetical protein
MLLLTPWRPRTTTAAAAPCCRYEGEFQAGYAHGLGMFTSPSKGEVYVGEFFAGQRHGWVAAAALGMHCLEGWRLGGLHARALLGSAGGHARRCSIWCSIWCSALHHKTSSPAGRQ